MSSDTLRMIFDQYDPEGLGQLDAPSFRQFLEELGRTGIPEEQFKRCFAVVDKAGTGVITKENFVEYVPYLYEVDFNPPVRVEKPKKVGKDKEQKPEYDPKDPSTFFVKIKKVGKGSYGQVFKALDSRTGEIIALKVIDIEGNEDEVETVQKEVVFQAQCKSPYIVQYYGSYLRGTELWISMEYLGGGSCLDLMKAGLPSERQIKVIMKQALLGLVYLHSTKKMHRDVKAGNLLVSTAGDIKLADFGVAAQIYQTVAAKCTFAGTPLWMSPEVIQQQPQTPAIDIWSLGITAIELAHGVPPKHDLHPMQVLFSVPDDPPPVLEGNFSDEFKNFVKVCLHKDPKHRPTAAQLLQHPFVLTNDSSEILIGWLKKYEGYKDASPHRASMIISDEAAQKPRESKFWDFDASSSTELDSEDNSEDHVDSPAASSSVEFEVPKATTPVTEKPKIEITPEDLQSPLGVALKEHALLEVFPVLKENDVDYESLLLLTEDDLKDLEIKLGTRKKLVRMIKILKEPKKRSAPKVEVPAAAVESPKAEMPPNHPPSRESSSGSLLLASSSSNLSLAEVSKGQLNKGDAKKWTIAEVSTWMAQEGFAEFIPQFEKNLIDGDALLKLDADSLRLLGMELVGTKLKFLGCVDSLRTPGTSMAPTLAKPTIVTNFNSPMASSPLSPSQSTKKPSLFKRVSFSSKKEDDIQTPPGTPPASSANNRNLQDALVNMGTYQRVKSQEQAQKEAVGTNVELPAPEITADQISDPEYAGWLIKQGGSRKNWKKRWFVLKDCALYYFPSPKGTKAKGMIILPSYTIWVAGEVKKKYAFKAVHVSARTYYFIANNYEDMKAWMKVMHEATVATKISPSPARLSESKDSKQSSETASQNLPTPVSQDPPIDLTPKKRESDAIDPNLQRFLDILSYVDEEELKPYFEMAKRDVEVAVGAYYASKMGK